MDFHLSPGRDVFGCLCSQEKITLKNKSNVCHFFALLFFYGVPLSAINLIKREQFTKTILGVITCVSDVLSRLVNSSRISPITRDEIFNETCLQMDLLFTIEIIHHECHVQTGRTSFQVKPHLPVLLTFDKTRVPSHP